MSSAKRGSIGSKVFTTTAKPLNSRPAMVRVNLSISSKRGSSVNGATNVLEQQSKLVSKLRLLSGPKALTGAKLDPLKPLAPNSKKLTLLESQRIIGIIEEVKQKSEVIAVLPHVMRNLAQFEELLGPELTDALAQHSVSVENLQMLEKVYFELVISPNLTLSPTPSTNAVAAKDVKSTRPDGAPSAVTTSIYPGYLPSLSHRNSGVNDSTSIMSRTQSRDQVKDSQSSNITGRVGELENAVFKLNRVKTSLEFSLKNILRVLRGKEEVMLTLLNEAGGGKSKQGAYYVQCLSDLRDMLLDKLLVSPIEQNDKMQFLAKVAAQEKNNRLVVEKLEAELAKAAEDKDEEIKRGNKTIQTLQVSLEVLEKSTEDDIRRAKTESEKQIQADNKASQIRKNKLSVDVKNLAAKLVNNTEEHRGEEEVLRKKRWKVESEVENWVQKYDADMTEKQDEYEMIDAVYQEEKKMLVELEQRFSVLELEYNNIMKERSGRKDEEARNSRLLERKTRAVIVIQAMWRAFRVRKRLKLQEKQKQKKKKGKKKKGKAKKR